MRWDIVMGLARTEARLTRRLARYWVFLVLTAIFVVVSYVYYAFIHGFFSSYSASVGSISPRYLIAGLGLWGIFLFVICLVFLAFDVRSRDERERIVEVLDSRPCTNLELVTGRFVGLLFMSWWPLAVMMLAIQLFGWLGATFHWRIGEPVVPSSVFAFLVLMAVPALCFALGLVFLLSFVLRNRLLTALASLTFLGVAIFLLFRFPFDILPLVDLFGAYTFDFPSEMGPSMFTTGTLVQRGAILAAGLGLLALSAVAHPRLDSGPRHLWAGAGVALLVVAIAGLAALYKQSLDARARFAGWQEAHEASRHEAAPDVERIAGQVAIDPGRSLTAELEIDFVAPQDAALENALFTLNPGFEVQGVTDGSGKALELTHRDGLLEVALARPLAPGESSELNLSFAGRPDIFFAYLDGALQFSELKLTNANLVLLGYYPSIFDRRYVALLPGIRWLPAAGADVGRGDPDRAVDFFHLDLTVELPEGWLIAGPGRRQAAEGAPAGRSSFRFAPGAMLPEAALVASRFERRATEIAGVEMELLLNPGHTRNLEVFAEARDEIVTWIDERLKASAEHGLAYPYDALTMVEVPTTLRSFGGGWRMDTALAPPAMLLVKESSFGTSRFDNRFRKPEDFEDAEGGIARAKRQALEGFFESDFNGGNIFLGAARNFFLYQTASQGTGSLALDFVCHDLANRLTTGKQGFFSAHIFGANFQQTIQNVLFKFLSQNQQGMTVADALLEAVSDRPEVWEQALGVALADMDPWEDPERAVNVLVLKGDAMSRWILDGLGRDRAGELLGAIRTHAAGRTFGREDLLAVAGELGIDFGDLTGDWLVTTELPGFTASSPRLYRLPDSEDGTPRYQLALHLRNDEASPGLLRLRYTLPDEGGSGNGRGPNRRWQESDPVRVGAGKAVEMGLVLSKPPTAVRIEPYLSLNRNAFAVPLPTLDQEKIAEAEPIVGVRPSEWRRTDTAAIVVDDLDDGFSVELDEKKSGLRLGVKAREDTLDQGLPVANAIQPPREWSRWPAGDAWGKYRHTAAMVKRGKGDKRVVFATELPKSGPWRLELYMPPARALRWKQGTYHLRVEDSSGSQDVTFDAGAAEEGWNMLDELEIASGEVRVTLSDETDGRVVVADAIRWRPARPSPAQEATDG